MKKVDEEAIKKLAQLHCTYDEIAEFSGVSTKTLQRNYVHLIKKGREMGRISLRRAQFEKALSGNVVMQIWLGKQHLDQRDKIEQTTYNEPLPLIINAKPEEIEDVKKKGNVFGAVIEYTKTEKGTSIGRRKITSTMNKHKRRQQKAKYRGQGK